MTHITYINFVVASVLIFTGLYCLLTMKNLIKLLIGAEIIAKGISLALIAGGFERNNIMIAQGLTITFIVIEVALVAVALAIIINIHKYTKELDIRLLKKLKG
ncbi:MAG: NADH-quinone oxidoreductase subunit K [Elusimicrobiota bacterium]